MKAFQRILAVLLCLVMSLGMISMVAFAADTFTQTTGKITIHKYELNGTPDAAATGKPISNEALPQGAKLLSGVTFTAYQVVDTTTLTNYYNGTANATTDKKIADAIATPSSLYTVTNGTYTVKDIDGNTVSAAGIDTTEADGLAEFTDMPLGLYLIVETEAPDKVVTPATPFLVSLPMTVDNEWLFDIHVYPKNSTSEGNVTVNKTDADGSPLADVEFKLEKPDGSEETQTTSTSGTVTWSSLTQGTYTITETDAPDGYIVDSRSIEFTVNTDNTITCADSRANFDNATKTLTLTLMNEKPTFTKTITANKDVAGVGETVSYELTTTVPQNIAEMDTYMIKDAPKGVSVVETSINVSVAGAGTLTKGTHYTVAMNADGGFALTFVTSKMEVDTINCAGMVLTVAYNATVTTAAVVDGEGKNANEAPNVATLTYSDDLTTNSTYAIDDDEVTKLYKATIIKRLDSTNGTLASGVKFNAYDNANCTTALKFTEEANGSYTLDPAGSVTDLVTDANGQIVINGLGKHTYYLVETETVEDYNLLSGSVEMKVGDETDFEYEITIVNKQGFNLPATGGIGTLMFIIIGGVLMAGGICLIVPNKKRAI